jgi:broad specificity phosphatase PhoE
MKIYFLRHEERFKSLTFFTPLNKQGKLNSIELIKVLNQLNLTKIYCSPYLRTLQTIEPFLNQSELKVNLENSIREANLYKLIPESEHDKELPEELYQQFKINEKYESFLNVDDINFPEKNKMVSQRFTNFLIDLIKKYENEDENILLVSHGGLIENFIRKLEKKYPNLKKIKPYSYPAGKITCIVKDNELIFDPINWKI